MVKMKYSLRIMKYRKGGHICFKEIPATIVSALQWAAYWAPTCRVRVAHQSVSRRRCNQRGTSTESARVFPRNSMNLCCRMLIHRLSVGCSISILTWGTSGFSRRDLNAGENGNFGILLLLPPSIFCYRLAVETGPGCDCGLVGGYGCVLFSQSILR